MNTDQKKPAPQRSRSEHTLLVPKAEAVDPRECPPGAFVYEGRVGIKTACGRFYAAEDGRTFSWGTSKRPTGSGIRVHPCQAWGRHKPAPSIQDDPDMGDLVDLAKTLSDPWNPLWTERARIWAGAFRLLEGSGTKPEDRSRFATRIKDYIFRNVPGMSRNRDSLNKAWHRKYSIWVEGGRATTALFSRSRQSGHWEDSRIPGNEMC